MLNLIFKNPKIDSASIPVRWCVDEESLQALQATGLIPFILLEVRYDRGFSRAVHLFPLDQMSAYIDVHYPGGITIKGTIVTAQDNKKDAIRRAFIINSADREPITPYAKHTIYVRQPYVVNTYESSEKYELMVPDDVFGKELPDWIKFFINRYWYENKPKDECAQRRRILMFPFTSLWLVLIEFVLWEATFLSNVLVYWSLLFPLKGTGVIHPFEYTFNELKRDTSRSVDNWWIFKLINRVLGSKHQDSTAAQIFGVLFCIPFIPLATLIITYTIWHFSSLSLLMSLGATFVGYYGVLILAFILAGIIMVLLAVCRWIGDKVPYIGRAFWFVIDTILNWNDKFVSWFNKLFEPNLKADMLICPEDDGSCLPPITWRDMSWRLRFATVKDKVCKPMRG